MNRDPRFALSQELEAKQTLLEQLHALAVEDPEFLTDLLKGETNLLELIAALDASIVDDEILADGAKAALDKLQARKLTAENRIELGSSPMPCVAGILGARPSRRAGRQARVREGAGAERQADEIKRPGERQVLA